MKYLVTATPTQVPMLAMKALRRTQEWHEQHAGLGCMMQLQDTGCLAGMLEAPDEGELRRALDAYPDRDCYTWTVMAATPMSECCARDMNTRMAPRQIRPTDTDRPDSVFPSWMTAASRDGHETPR